MAILGNNIAYSTMLLDNKNVIWGGRFTMPAKNGVAKSMTARYSAPDIPAVPYKVKCLIYKQSDFSLVGETEELTISTALNDWKTFRFITQPTLIANTEYLLCSWCENHTEVFRLTGQASGGSGYEGDSITYGTAPDPLVPTVHSTTRLISIYCNYNCFGHSTFNNNSNQAANVINAMRFLCPVDSTSEHIEMLFTTGGAPVGSYRLAIYSDVYPTPGTKLWEGTTQTSAEGWQGEDTTAIPLTANTYYWLAFNLSTTQKLNYLSGQPASSHAWKTGQTFANAFPTSWGSSSGANTNQYTLRLCYNPSATLHQIQIGDAWKTVKAMQINIGDSWKAVEGEEINVGDAWKTIL